MGTTIHSLKICRKYILNALYIERITIFNSFFKEVHCTVNMQFQHIGTHTVYIILCIAWSSLITFIISAVKHCSRHLGGLSYPCAGLSLEGGVRQIFWGIHFGLGQECVVRFIRWTESRGEIRLFSSLIVVCNYLVNRHVFGYLNLHEQQMVNYSCSLQCLLCSISNMDTESSSSL